MLLIECGCRLKIGNGIQYVLNGKGTTPAEIMGIDHKIMLKPALISFADEIKKVSMEKREECTSTRQKSDQNAARLEHKKNQLEAVQLRIDEVSVLLYGYVCHVVSDVISFHLAYVIVD